MKKAAILLSLIMILSLAACGSSGDSKEFSVPLVSPSPTPTAEIQPSETSPMPTPKPKPEETALPDPVPAEAISIENGDSESIDVDLTQLSSTMVYSEVSAMMYEPEQYIGKTVKMRGLFGTQEYNGEQLFACIVQDATACCAQGLEFELAGNHVYPKDYPKPGTEITVIGTFDSYKEEVEGNYYIYLVLRNARFV